MKQAAAMAYKVLDPNFTNNNSASVLVSQSSAKSHSWWLAFVVLPPFVWLASLLFCNRNSFARRLPSLKSAATQAQAAIERARRESKLKTP